MAEDVDVKFQPLLDDEENDADSYSFQPERRRGARGWLIALHHCADTCPSWRWHILLATEQEGARNLHNGSRHSGQSQHNYFRNWSDQCTCRLLAELLECGSGQRDRCQGWAACDSGAGACEALYQ